MKQLETKISEINQAIRSHISCDLKGLSISVKLEKGETRKEVDNDIVVDFNTDTDLSGYHMQDGEVNFDRFQNRGKGKVYFPIAPMSLICVTKNRHLEEVVFNILKEIPNIKIKTSNSDKYSIWKDETGKNDPNFDLYFFKIGYDFNFTTKDCEQFCK
jgi:hypothetical protein